MALSTILVTGAGGFVGQQLLPALQAAFPAARVVGTGMTRELALAMDVTDAAQVTAVIAALAPDVCIHLAGISTIGAARADPDMAWRVNLHGTLNLARAILAAAPACRMIFVSSSECYGESFKSGQALNEGAVLAPMNLYAATKAAAEMALGPMAAAGLRLARLRPFNHTGPGQREDFVVPAFAGQIARIEAGLVAPEMAVGALEPERDFLDVRDVCAAYIACVRNFDRLANNQVINIASGRAVRIGMLLEMLLAQAQCPIAVRRDPARLRPVEIMRATGDPRLAWELFKWRPVQALEETLAAVLNAARDREREISR